MLNPPLLVIKLPFNKLHSFLTTGVFLSPPFNYKELYLFNTNAELYIRYLHGNVCHALQIM